ncbi:hypothetical protein JCM8547_007623 [Rhodosporidiobolus lusitaniae]
MTRPPPYFRTHSSPAFSSSSSSSESPCPASSRPPPTLHSALLHSLPLPHLLFSPTLHLHSLNDAARYVFGVTSGHGGPSHGGGDFPPGGADSFFCVTEDMKGKGAQDKIRRELERLAQSEEERAAGGGGGGGEWAWGEGGRVELKSGRVPGLRWAAEVKVTKIVPPSASSSSVGDEVRRSSRYGSEYSVSDDGQGEEEDDDLPSWLGRRETLMPSPTTPSRAYYSVLLLRPWRDPVPPLHPAHEKLLSHRRSFSLDTPFAPGQPPFSSPSLFQSGYAPTVTHAPAAPSPLAAPPNFSTFTFPPIASPSASSPGPSTAPSLHPITTTGASTAGVVRRKESYSERTPTLGSVSGGNPFAWSSIAQRRESTNSLGTVQEHRSAVSSPNLAAGSGPGGNGWEFSRPFGSVLEEGSSPSPPAGSASPPKRPLKEVQEEKLASSAAPPPIPLSLPATATSQLLARRRSSLEGSPADPRAWPVVSRGPDASPPPARSAIDEGTPLPPAIPSSFRIPLVAASAISPRTAAGLGAGPGGGGGGSAGSAGSANSGSSSGGTSQRSFYSSSPGTATTNATSPSRRGSAASLPPPVLPDALKGMGISVSSAGIQITQSSAPAGQEVVKVAAVPSRSAGAPPVVVPTSAAAGTPFTPTPAEDVATPSFSSVLTPTPTATHPSLHREYASALPPSVHFPLMNRKPSFHLHQPPRPHPLSLSRSAGSSSSASLSSPSSSHAQQQPPLHSPRPTALPPLPPKLPTPKPDPTTLLKFAGLSSLPKTGVIISDAELGSGYVNALARELLLGVPATDGLNGNGGKDTSNSSTTNPASSPSAASSSGSIEDWWHLGEWTASDDDGPWTSMSASASSAGHFSSTSTTSQPFFSPSAASEVRTNPFDAKDLQFHAIIAAGEASSVERGKGTAGSGLRIGRAAESDRYRNVVARLVARSLVTDDRRKAALGRGQPLPTPGLSTAAGGMGAGGGLHQGFSAFGAFKSPGATSSGSSGSINSASTTAAQIPSFISSGGKPYKVYDEDFSQRTIDPLEPLTELVCRKGEEPPRPPPEEEEDDEPVTAGGTVYNGMVIGVETEVWEASPSSFASGSGTGPGPSSLKNDSFVTSTSSGTAAFSSAPKKKRVRRRIIEVTATPLFAPTTDGGKKHIGGMLLLKDVTDERKRASAREGESRGSRRKGKGDGYFKQILDKMPQMVWTTTPLGSHTFFNLGWYEYTGLEPEQSLGLGWQSPFHEEDMPSALKAWSHSLETGEPYAVEYRCRRYDGEWRWMLGRALPYRDADGVIQGWFGSCTDFHELYHMREQLRSTLQQNDAVLAGASCLLIAVDNDTNVQFYEGQSKMEMLAEMGITPPIEGKSLAVLKPSEQFMASVKKVLKGEAPEGCVESLGRLGRHYRCLLTPLKQTRIDNSVQIVGCIIVAHDITDLVQTQQQLQQSYEERARLQASETAATEASRLKSDFLAFTSHELRTPVSHILGLSELLLAEDLTEVQRNLAAQVVRSSDVLLEMIGQVLDMGKVEAGKLDLELRAFDLNELSTDARLFSTAARKKGLDFVEDIEHFNVQVLGDMPRLRQVLTNLLSNAIKFTKQGSITLRVNKLEEDEASLTVQWQVQDTGVGIRKDAQSSLFKPFHQADVSTSRQFGGTGLGLSISKNLIELMGGSVSLESEYGVGTVMTAKCKFEKAPLAEHPSSAPPTPNPNQPDVARSDTNVLIVDDNALNRQIIARLLEKMGFNVDTASSGYEALDKVSEPSKKRYQVCLMDHQMDGLDGLETTIRIRNSPNPLIRDIKIIALTASALKGDQEKFLAAGADGYLSKPVRSAVLEQTIVNTLQPAPSVSRRKSSAATVASVASSAAAVSSDNDDDLGGAEIRRRPSHPSYGEGQV